VLFVAGFGFKGASQFFRASAEAERSAAPALARLSSTTTIRAQGRSNPQINLSDGREVLTDYEGPAELVRVLRANLAAPLASAAGDFDEDGVPDLVIGYAGAGSGIISLLRGNVDAIYPNSPEAQARRAAGAGADAPFLSPAQVFEALQSPDFIGAGD